MNDCVMDHNPHEAQPLQKQWIQWYSLYQQAAGRGATCFTGSVQFSLKTEL